jgi:hypothetical protein
MDAAICMPRVARAAGATGDAAPGGLRRGWGGGLRGGGWPAVAG